MFRNCQQTPARNCPHKPVSYKGDNIHVLSHDKQVNDFHDVKIHSFETPHRKDPREQWRKPDEKTSNTKFATLGAHGGMRLLAEPGGSGALDHQRSTDPSHPPRVAYLGPPVRGSVN